MAKDDVVFQLRFHLAPCGDRRLARALGLHEDLRWFLPPWRWTDDALLRPYRETIFSVCCRSRRDRSVVLPRPPRRRQEPGVRVTRALGLGPLCSRLAFRHRLTDTQWKALGIGGPVAVLMVKRQGELPCYVVVPPWFSWAPLAARTSPDLGSVAGKARRRDSSAVMSQLLDIVTLRGLCGVN